jgi:hypothetical protein
MSVNFLINVWVGTFTVGIGKETSVFACGLHPIRQLSADGRIMSSRIMSGSPSKKVQRDGDKKE